jgi:arylsulfatase A-like enzyme
MRRGRRALRTHGRRGRSALLSMVVVGLLTACSGSKLPSRPNILLLTVDTLRADHLSSYGYARATSPVLDQLASEGVRFTLAQAQWPKTAPSFASLMTATYPKDNGVVRRVGMPIPCSLRLLAEELSELGYSTGAVVANGALSRDFFFDQGFGNYVEAWKGARTEQEIEEATRAGRVTDLALELLARLDGEKPFFLWVHYLDPHFPYRPPESWQDRFQDDGVFPPRPAMKVDLDRHRQVHGGIGASQVLSGRSDLDFYVARYDAEIAYTDHEIGRLLDVLRERGLYDEMLTIFTSDHGEALGDHDYYFDHGALPFQDCTRVPLAVRFPGVFAPRVDSDAVELLHLAPTMLELAGAELPRGEWAQGRSLVGRLRGRTSGAGTLAFSESGYTRHRRWMKSVTDGRFKLVWAPAIQDQRQLDGPGIAYLLFDLEADPDELRNLAASRPEEVERLGRSLRAWFAAAPFAVHRDPDVCGAPREAAPETLEQLRALGYL